VSGICLFHIGAPTLFFHLNIILWRQLPNSEYFWRSSVSWSAIKLSIFTLDGANGSRPRVWRPGYTPIYSLGFLVRIYPIVLAVVY